MSSASIPYPLGHDIDVEAEWLDRQRAEALKVIDPGDVLATVHELLDAEPDPTRHPLYGMVQCYLDRTWACDGGRLFDAWKALVLQAIDRCMVEQLSREDR